MEQSKGLARDGEMIVVLTLPGMIRTRSDPSLRDQRPSSPLLTHIGPLRLIRFEPSVILLVICVVITHRDGVVEGSV